MSRSISSKLKSNKPNRLVCIFLLLITLTSNFSYALTPALAAFELFRKSEFKNLGELGETVSGMGDKEAMEFLNSSSVVCSKNPEVVFYDGNETVYKFSCLAVAKKDMQFELKFNASNRLLDKTANKVRFLGFVSTDSSKLKFLGYDRDSLKFSLLYYPYRNVFNVYVASAAPLALIPRSSDAKTLQLNSQEEFARQLRTMQSLEALLFLKESYRQMMGFEPRIAYKLASLDAPDAVSKEVLLSLSEAEIVTLMAGSSLSKSLKGKQLAVSLEGDKVKVAENGVETGSAEISVSFESTGEPVAETETLSLSVATTSPATTPATTPAATPAETNIPEITYLDAVVFTIHRYLYDAVNSIVKPIRQYLSTLSSQKLPEISGVRLNIDPELAFKVKYGKMSQWEQSIMRFFINLRGAPPSDPSLTEALITQDVWNTLITKAWQWALQTPDLERGAEIVVDPETGKMYFTFLEEPLSALSKETAHECGSSFCLAYRYGLREISGVHTHPSLGEVYSDFKTLALSRTRMSTGDLLSALRGQVSTDHVIIYPDKETGQVAISIWEIDSEKLKEDSAIIEAARKEMNVVSNKWNWMDNAQQAWNELIAQPNYRMLQVKMNSVFEREGKIKRVYFKIFPEKYVEYVESQREEIVTYGKLKFTRSALELGGKLTLQGKDILFVGPKASDTITYAVSAGIRISNYDEIKAFGIYSEPPTSFAGTTYAENGIQIYTSEHGKVITYDDLQRFAKNMKELGTNVPLLIFRTGVNFEKKDIMTITQWFNAYDINLKKISDENLPILKQNENEKVIDPRISILSAKEIAKEISIPQLPAAEEKTISEVELGKAVSTSDLNAATINLIRQASSYEDALIFAGERSWDLTKEQYTAMQNWADKEAEIVVTELNNGAAWEDAFGKAKIMGGVAATPEKTKEELMDETAKRLDTMHSSEMKVATETMPGIGKEIVLSIDANTVTIPPEGITINTIADFDTTQFKLIPNNIILSTPYDGPVGQFAGMLEYARSLKGKPTNEIVEAVRKLIDDRTVFPYQEEIAKLRNPTSNLYDPALADWVEKNIMITPSMTANVKLSDVLSHVNKDGKSFTECRHNALMSTAMLQEAGIKAWPQSGSAINAYLSNGEPLFKDLSRFQIGKTVSHAWTVFLDDNGKLVVFDPTIKINGVRGLTSLEDKLGVFSNYMATTSWYDKLIKNGDSYFLLEFSYGQNTKEGINSRGVIEKGIAVGVSKTPLDIKIIPANFQARPDSKLRMLLPSGEIYSGSLDFQIKIKSQGIFQGYPTLKISEIVSAQGGITATIIRGGLPVESVASAVEKMIEQGKEVKEIKAEQAATERIATESKTAAINDAKSTAASIQNSETTKAAMNEIENILNSLVADGQLAEESKNSIMEIFDLAVGIKTNYLLNLLTDSDFSLLYDESLKNINYQLAEIPAVQQAGVRQRMIELLQDIPQQVPQAPQRLTTFGVEFDEKTFYISPPEEEFRQYSYEIYNTQTIASDVLKKTEKKISEIERISSADKMVASVEVGKEIVPEIKLPTGDHRFVKARDILTPVKEIEVTPEGNTNVHYLTPTDAENRIYELRQEKARIEAENEVLREKAQSLSEEARKVLEKSMDPNVKIGEKLYTSLDKKVEYAKTASGIQGKVSYGDIPRTVNFATVAEKLNAVSKIDARIVAEKSLSAMSKVEAKAFEVPVQKVTIEVASTGKGSITQTGGTAGTPTPDAAKVVTTKVSEIDEVIQQMGLTTESSQLAQNLQSLKDIAKSQELDVGVTIADAITAKIEGATEITLTSIDPSSGVVTGKASVDGKIVNFEYNTKTNSITMETPLGKTISFETTPVSSSKAISLESVTYSGAMSLQELQSNMQFALDNGLTQKIDLGSLGKIEFDNGNIYINGAKSNLNELDDLVSNLEESGISRVNLDMKTFGRTETQALEDMVNQRLTFELQQSKFAARASQFVQTNLPTILAVADVAISYYQISQQPYAPSSQARVTMLTMVELPYLAVAQAASWGWIESSAVASALGPAGLLMMAGQMVVEPMLTEYYHRVELQEMGIAPANGFFEQMANNIASGLTSPDIRLSTESDFYEATAQQYASEFLQKAVDATNSELAQNFGSRAMENMASKVSDFLSSGLPSKTEVGTTFTRISDTQVSVEVGGAGKITYDVSTGKPAVDKYLIYETKYDAEGNPLTTISEHSFQAQKNIIFGEAGRFASKEWGFLNEKMSDIYSSDIKTVDELKASLEKVVRDMKVENPEKYEAIAKIAAAEGKSLEGVLLSDLLGKSSARISTEATNVRSWSSIVSGIQPGDLNENEQQTFQNELLSAQQSLEKATELNGFYESAERQSAQEVALQQQAAIDQRLSSIAEMLGKSGLTLDKLQGTGMEYKPGDTMVTVHLEDGRTMSFDIRISDAGIEGMAKDMAGNSDIKDYKIDEKGVLNINFKDGTSQTTQYDSNTGKTTTTNFDASNKPLLESVSKIVGDQTFIDETNLQTGETVHHTLSRTYDTQAINDLKALLSAAERAGNYDDAAQLQAQIDALQNNPEVASESKFYDSNKNLVTIEIRKTENIGGVDHSIFEIRNGNNEVVYKSDAYKKTEPQTVAGVTTSYDYTFKEISENGKLAQKETTFTYSDGAMYTVVEDGTGNRIAQRISTPGPDAKFEVNKKTGEKTLTSGSMAVSLYDADGSQVGTQQVTKDSKTGATTAVSFDNNGQMTEKRVTTPSASGTTTEVFDPKDKKIATITVDSANNQKVAYEPGTKVESWGGASRDTKSVETKADGTVVSITEVTHTFESGRPTEKDTDIRTTAAPGKDLGITFEVSGPFAGLGTNTATATEITIQYDANGNIIGATATAPGYGTTQLSAEEAQRIAKELKEKEKEKEKDKEKEKEKCFLAGTKILMADGSYKNIEDVKEGERVASYDFAAEKVVGSLVSKTFVHAIDGEYIVVNNKLRVTSNHPLFANGKWVEAGKIKIGDKLLDSSGNYVVIYSVTIERGSMKVYNLEVEEGKNYFAENVLVHNKDAGPGTGTGVNWNPEDTYVASFVNIDKYVTEFFSQLYYQFVKIFQRGSSYQTTTSTTIPA